MRRCLALAVVRLRPDAENHPVDAARQPAFQRLEPRVPDNVDGCLAKLAAGLRLDHLDRADLTPWRHIVAQDRPAFDGALLVTGRKDKARLFDPAVLDLASGVALRFGSGRNRRRGDRLGPRL